MHIYYISRYKGYKGYNAYIKLSFFFLAISAFVSFYLQNPTSTAEDLPRTNAGRHRAPLRQLHVRPTPLLLASKIARINGLRLDFEPTRSTYRVDLTSIVLRRFSLKKPQG